MKGDWFGHNAGYGIVDEGRKRRSLSLVVNARVTSRVQKKWIVAMIGLVEMENHQ
jgi:hypothetical protein